METCNLCGEQPTAQEQIGIGVCGPCEFPGMYILQLPRRVGLLQTIDGPLRASDYIRDRNEILNVLGHTLPTYNWLK